jgi:long-chain fatty acid transport protein
VGIFAKKCLLFPSFKLKIYPMRKLLTLITATFITGSLFAGGLVTNNNQSVMFTRMQNRNASTDIDAVFFNPAGLTKLDNGFYISLNNQTISQTQKITNNYNYLSGTPKEYVGKVSAPIYPGVYVAFKAGKFALSAGFNPIGGGGGAKYDKGLPSFEMRVADLVPLLISKEIPTTQYSADINFEGTSVYYGYQANASYEINKMISVAAGLRLVSAKNTYTGSLKSISVDPTYPAFGAAYTGGLVSAKDFFTSGATTLNLLSAGATAFVAGLQPIVTGGGGSTLLANGTSVGLTAEQVGQIQQILGAAGLTPAQIGAQTIASAQGVLSAAAPEFNTNATKMTGYAASTADIYVDAERTGMGYTPILSLNFSPSDKLNIAVKYEFKTKLELTTKVKDNKGGGIFTDGAKIIADLPAILFVGVQFKPVEKLMLAGTFNYYFDKNVDYDGSELLNINMIDKNFFEYGLGAEYGVTDKLRVSAGWLATNSGVSSNYQSDMDYSTDAHSFGAGFGFHILPMIDLNVGGQYTLYSDDSKTFNHMLDTFPVPVTEIYKKSTWLVGVGLDFYFGM